MIAQINHLLLNNAGGGSLHLYLSINFNIIDGLEYIMIERMNMSFLLLNIVLSGINIERIYWIIDNNYPFDNNIQNINIGLNKYRPKQSKYSKINKILKTNDLYYSKFCDPYGSPARFLETNKSDERIIKNIMKNTTS